MSKAKSKHPKKPKKKPAWRALVPGGTILPTMTLDELRSVKQVHALLTETFPGPPIVGYAIRSFRFCEMYAIAAIVENTFPALVRCWKELERLFMHDPAYRDGYFVPSWILFDFPCDSDRRTLLDHFENFVEGCGKREEFATFIHAVRDTRLGVYQEILRTATSVSYREFFTERVVDVVPSIEPGEPGEILLGRIIELDGLRYFWGEVRAFPRERYASIAEMIENKLFYFENKASTLVALYEVFMKLAGPYWMSVAACNDRLPILDPDHYETYLEP